MSQAQFTAEVDSLFDELANHPGLDARAKGALIFLRFLLDELRLADYIYGYLVRRGWISAA